MKTNKEDINDVVPQEKRHSVKSIEYYENGKIRKVEFLTPKDYNPVTFPTLPPLSTFPIQPLTPYYNPTPYDPWKPLPPVTVSFGISNTYGLLNETTNDNNSHH